MPSTYAVAHGDALLTVEGFAPGIDVVDLSAFGGIGWNDGLSVLAASSESGPATLVAMEDRPEAVLLVGITPAELTAASFRFSPDGVSSVSDVTGTSLYGGSGEDVMSGGAGNDTLHGGGGDDLMVGGRGNDSLRGGDGADRMWGGDGDDLIFASNGDDRLDGGAGADSLFGGTGNDILTGGAGADWLVGGTGDDTYVVEGGDHIVENAGEGNDTVESAASYALGTNLENLTLTGTGNVDGTGNELDNRILGNSGANTLSGGAGADTIRGGSGNDHLLGGAGDDLIFASNGDDVLEGGDGADSLFGGAGDDILIGGAGTDYLVGGTGSDTASYGAETVGLTADLADWTANTGAAAGDRYYDIENLEGSSGDDTLRGNDVANVIAGGAGADTIRGGSGDDHLLGDAGGDLIFASNGDDNLEGGDGADSLFGGAGDDVLTGGAGNDWLIGGAGADRFVFTGDDGADHVADFTAGPGRGDVLDFSGQGLSFADLTLADMGANVTITNTLTSATVTLMGVHAADLRADDFVGLTGSAWTVMGTDGNDTLIGGDGNDTLYAGAGNDLADGGGGNDTLIGGSGAGDDTYIGGPGTDEVIYSSATEGITVALGEGTTPGTASGPEIGTDSLTGIENVTGGAGNDLISGNSGDNVIHGGAGVDFIYGNGGNDTLYGDDGNDYLRADYGDDTLIGGGGDDVLNGQIGNNVLTGGSGNDVFLVNTADGETVITDFTAGAGTEDVLAFGNAISQEDLTITQSGADTLIDFGTADSARVVLENVTASDLSAADLDFGQIAVIPDAPFDGWTYGVQTPPPAGNATSAMARALGDMDLITKSWQVLDPDGVGSDDMSGYSDSFLMFRLIASNLTDGNARTWLAEYESRSLGGETSVSNFDPNVTNPTAVHVSSAAELQTALSNHQGGLTILLDAGNYGTLNLSSADFTDTVVLRSADGNGGAVFDSVRLDGVSNMIFDDITVNRPFTASDYDWTQVFTVNHSQNVAILNSEISGSEASKGYGVSSGGTTGLIVENTEFHHLYRGAVIAGDQDVVVKDNTAHDLRSDGFDFTGVNHVQIEGNHFSPFTPLNGDHADAIQFWTEGSTGSNDVVLRNNVMLVGDGTQGIFVWDETGDGYSNFTVEGNVYYGTSLHGITVANLTNGLIQNNTVVGSPGAPDWAARINVSPHGTVAMLNNVANAVSTSGFDQISGNVILDYTDTTSPNYIGNLFVSPQPASDAMALADFAPRAGGLLDGTDKGAVATDGMIASYSGGETLTGTANSDILTGTPGDDILTGSTGDDTLRGDTGNDIFVFNAGDGHDTVVDFENGADRLDYSSQGITFADLSITQSGADTVVGNSVTGDTVTLAGIAASSITAHDFIF